MKHKNYLQGVVGYIRKELEVALAVLIVLGFIFGYSLASTELASGDVQIAQAPTSAFSINGGTYNAINFTTQNVAGAYRVRSGFSRPDIAQTTEGVKGQSAGAEYAFTLPLDAPFSGTVYVWGTFTRGVTLGTTLVNSPAGPVRLVNANEIQLRFRGGDTISRIALVPDGTATETSRTVAALTLLPSAATVTAGSTYNFIALARDAAGATIDAPTLRWSVDNTALATINSVTGQLTAKTAGKVIVKVTADGTQASATVTIVEAPVATTLPARTTAPAPATQTPATQSPADTSESTSVLDRISDALNGNQATTPSTDGAGTAVETKAQTAVTAALDAFAATQASRTAEQGSAYVPQAEVKTIISATAQTATERFAITFQLGLKQIASDLSEMFSPDSPKNVFKTIGSAIANMFTRGAGAGQEGLLDENFKGEGDLQ